MGDEWRTDRGARGRSSNLSRRCDDNEIGADNRAVKECKTPSNTLTASHVPSYTTHTCACINHYRCVLNLSHDLSSSICKHRENVVHLDAPTSHACARGVWAACGASAAAALGKRDEAWRAPARSRARARRAACFPPRRAASRRPSSNPPRCGFKPCRASANAPVRNHTEFNRSRPNVDRNRPIVGSEILDENTPRLVEASPTSVASATNLDENTRKLVETSPHSVGVETMLNLGERTQSVLVTNSISADLAQIWSTPRHIWPTQTRFCVWGEAGRFFEGTNC